MSPETRRGMTARMQDAINDIRTREREDTPIGWIIQDDTLRIVQPMTAQGGQAGQRIDPDTILVRSYTADQDTGELTPAGSWTLPNPIGHDLRGPTGMYADRVLGAAVFDLARHDDRPVTAQGASISGPVTLEDPIRGGDLANGWRDAMTEAVARRTATDPDLIRASYLQEALERTPRPFTWAMEEDGQDVHVVAWHDLDSPQGATYDFTHLQYGAEDGRPAVTAINGTREPERASPGPMDGQRMMAESARLIHTYQQEVRYPAAFGPIPEPDYTQAGIVRQGEHPQILLDDGTPAPRWDRLTGRITEAALTGPETPTPPEGAPTKGTTMAEQPQYDQVQQILGTIDNDERLNARLEGYAEGLAASRRDNPEPPAEDDQGVKDVAMAIAVAGISQYEQDQDRPATVDGPQINRIADGVAERIREYVQDQNLDRAAPDRDAPKTEWARVSMPSQYVHPYQLTAKDGRIFDKAIISLPEGTKINGIDVSGYAIDRFMSDAMRQAKANGRRVTLSFPTDKRVELFKGKGADKQTIRLDGPWELVKGIKAHLQAWREEHAARPGQEKPGAHDDTRQGADRQEPRPARQGDGHRFAAMPGPMPQRQEPAVEPPVAAQDMPHELATYAQNDEKTWNAIESVTDRAARDTAAGHYDPEHTREVMQRVTDKAAERYNGPQGPLPGGPAFSREVRAAATAEIMKDTADMIREKAQALQPARQEPHRPAADAGRTSGRPEPAGKNNFLADLVHRTDSRMRQQAPAVKAQEHEHSRGRR